MDWGYFQCVLAGLDFRLFMQVSPVVILHSLLFMSKKVFLG